MAKILFGVGVSDARAKLGGHVFSKNRNGAYLRMKVSPTQPRTTNQLNVRSLFGQFSQAWGQILSDAQRSGWKALASSNPTPDRFGNPQILTGLQFYQRVNRNLSTIGVARLDTAPAGTTVESLISVTLTATFTGSVLHLNFTPTPLGPTSHLVIFATHCVSPGRSFLTPFLKLSAADVAPASASPFDFFGPWTAIYGALQPGQAIGVSAFVIDDVTGAASAPATDSQIVAP